MDKISRREENGQKHRENYKKNRKKIRKVLFFLAPADLHGANYIYRYEADSGAEWIVHVKQGVDFGSIN